MSDFFNPAGNPTNVLTNETPTGTPAPTAGGDYPVFIQLPTTTASQTPATFRQGDIPPSRVCLLQDAQSDPIDITNCTVTYALWTKKTASNGTVTPSTQVFQHNAVVVLPTLGIVRYDWQASDTTLAGVYREEWSVTNALSGQVLTFPGSGVSPITILAHGG